MWLLNPVFKNDMIYERKTKICFKMRFEIEFRNTTTA